MVQVRTGVRWAMGGSPELPSQIGRLSEPGSGVARGLPLEAVIYSGAKDARRLRVRGREWFVMSYRLPPCTGALIPTDLCVGG